MVIVKIKWDHSSQALITVFETIRIQQMVAIISLLYLINYSWQWQKDNSSNITISKGENQYFLRSVAS